MSLFAELGIDFKVVAIQLVGFLLLFFLLKKFLFSKVSDILEQRKNDIATTYDKIHKDTQEMEKLKKEYQEHLLKIEDEHREKVAEFIKEGEQIKSKIVEEARAEATKIKDKALKEIEIEKEKTLAILKEEVVNLTILATSKVVGEILDESKHHNLIKTTIDSIKLS